MHADSSVVLITGAGKRIGRAIAIELARRGCNIVVHYGKSAAEAADATGLSLETVRSYLKQVLCKTGTHRQTELIALYYGWTLPVGKSIASAELRKRH